MTVITRTLLVLIATSAAGGCRGDAQSPATAAPAGRGSAVASTPLPPPQQSTAPSVEARSVAAAGLGQACVVHFRRDALGISSGTGVIEPTAANVGPRTVTLRGRLVARAADWIVVDGDGGKRYTIPTGAVLVIESEVGR